MITLLAALNTHAHGMRRRSTTRSAAAAAAAASAAAACPGNTSTTSTTTTTTTKMKTKTTTTTKRTTTTRATRTEMTPASFPSSLSGVALDRERRRCRSSTETRRVSWTSRNFEARRSTASRGGHDGALDEQR
ncbi:hypothetical protein WN48_07455 [Eufriesea mexicana]|uniref:Uncharacterized protein n=1 Tax=Eufriesea mexicana TaxID=516756 RepID=A0A310SH61_9HYME|nr:hypothetical protein WN48_07455 [Eufriesea mexicana]